MENDRKFLPESMSIQGQLFRMDAPLPCNDVRYRSLVLQSLPIQDERGQMFGNADQWSS